MIYATFNDSMVSMLKSFIGCEFNSYEYVSIGNGAYGNLTGYAGKNYRLSDAS